MTAAWALLPFAALAFGIALAVDYEREQRRRHRARGSYAAQMRRLTAAFDEARAAIDAALLPALRQMTVAVRDFNDAWSKP